MEPYRPIVDDTVFLLAQSTNVALSPESKKVLAGLLDVDVVNHQDEVSPISTTMGYVVQSFCSAIAEGKGVLAYPKVILPTDRML